MSLISFDEYQAKRRTFHTADFEEGTGVACSVCTGELFDRGRPILLSHPPQKAVYCKGCGWAGTILA